MAELPKYFYFRVHPIRNNTGAEIEDASDVDVVECVRCRDCKFCEPYMGHYLCMTIFGLADIEADDFCSRGEKKDADVNT